MTHYRKRKIQARISWAERHITLITVTFYTLMAITAVLLGLALIADWKATKAEMEHNLDKQRINQASQ
jgi:hypothetical protein